ncbi:MAG: phenylalanine--tRNA ligase subunit alpha [Chlamydiae bacterium]|nr:phenylalanine--tRNA ligase subunit alpha [Chlamydiota bacterium]MBI3266073.1 phenylalanine--tRNA ligase subunit alpha [Chlamydiota bacterium]
METSIQSLSSKVHDILQEAEKAIHASQSLDALDRERVHWLGRKGVLTEFLKGLGKLPPDQKPQVGKIVHTAKEKVETWLEACKLRLESEKRKIQLQQEKLDITLPGKSRKYGHLHPLTRVASEIVNVFVQMGFSVEEGPEIETDYYNFEALNIPKDHPARDMQDTLYLSKDLLLRTHTSPIQIHVMKERKPPLRVIAPGRVYRADDVDVSHSPMFHQVEGFYVDRDVSFAHLKYTLVHFAKRIFGEKTRLRFRPSFFPFTEPSAEVDIACSVCEGSGCRLCSGRGWLEILGAGMIHPNVFEAVGYDPSAFTGFAFGMGVERIAMLKYGIHDIRLFFENDMRFLEQF